MNLEPMRYKDYVWRNNPRQIKITHNRNVKEVSVPYSRGIVRDYGGRMRIVSGAGEFFGENCMQEFERLRALHLEGGKGYLILPDMKPFLAVFKLLEMEENPIPKLLKYNFEFWECTDECECKSCFVKRYHVVKDGETLWHIANKYNRNIEDLLELNPHIKRPDTVTDGEKVQLI